MNIPTFQLTPRVLPKASAAHAAPLARKHTPQATPAATVEISAEARHAAGHQTLSQGRGPDNVIWGNSPKK